MAPDDKRKISEDERELLQKWRKSLTPEEARAWADAHIEDLETEEETLKLKKAELEMIRQVVAPIIAENPGMKVGEAMELILRSEQRTLREAEALDAYDRMQ